MAEVAIQDILQRIDGLSGPDRLLLEQLLAQRAEAEWLVEAEAARAVARDRGIGQDAIDKAVEESRYPGTPKHP